MARLVIARGPNAGTVFTLEDAATIGRGSDNDVVVDASEVSRRHARITREEGVYVITDLGSKNGTAVNGDRLTEPRRLRNGDLIAIAGIDFVLESGDERATQTMQSAAFAIPRRAPAPASATIVLKPETAEVIVRGTPVQLPPKEYLALRILYERRGELVTKEELAERVWPEYAGDVSDYNVHQVISRLRRALEQDPARPTVLVTRPGFGYRLVV